HGEDDHGVHDGDGPIASDPSWCDVFAAAAKNVIAEVFAHAKTPVETRRQLQKNKMRREAARQTRRTKVVRQTTVTATRDVQLQNHDDHRVTKTVSGGASPFVSAASAMQ
ncbi:unnamed protein product, partial [Amoebophrya sp. A25]